ncbi:hypothetical protein EON63_13645 [archaeon]|nr:MAG: hypothetical protein EON63_13645 [archaeon]
MQDIHAHEHIHTHTQALVAAAHGKDGDGDGNENNDNKISPVDTPTLVLTPISPPTFDPILRDRTYILMMWLNFTTRGVIAIMETQASQILLSHYNMSEIRLGVFVSFAGMWV